MAGLVLLTPCSTASRARIPWPYSSDLLPAVTKSPKVLAKPGQRTKNSFKSQLQWQPGGHSERAPSLFSPTHKTGIPHHQQQSVETFQTVDVITAWFVSKAKWNAVPFTVTMRLLHILHSVQRYVSTLKCSIWREINFATINWKSYIYLIHISLFL